MSDRRVKQTFGSELDRQLMSVVDRRVGNTRVSLNTGSSISEVWETDTFTVTVRDTVERSLYVIYPIRP